MNKVRKIIHQVFSLGIFLKGVNGLLEIIGGILLFFIDPGKLNQIILWLTQYELSEDPQDFMANFLVNAAHSFSVGAWVFGMIYLLSHGIIKIFLVICLFKRKLWAYPLAIIFFSIFIIYQVYRYHYTHSMGLIFLTIFDFLIIILTLWEYQWLKRECARV